MQVNHPQGFTKRTTRKCSHFVQQKMQQTNITIYLVYMKLDVNEEYKI